MITDAQTKYLLPNFRTGQTTGRWLVAEIEASEMSNEAHGTDDPGLLRASGSSGQSATVRLRETGELDVQASSEDINFSQANY